MKKLICALLAVALIFGLFCPALATEETTPETQVPETAEQSAVQHQDAPVVEEVYQPEEDPLAAEADRLKERCRTTYRQALAASGKEKFQGFCGMMTGYVAWKMGITRGPETYDGNDFFDIYQQQTVTSNGYPVRTISAEAMNLEEALNHLTACGTRNVYNLIICFQWTNTEAGAVCGHVLPVQGVVDGMVYFVESFPTSIGGAEGNPIVCSISQFDDFFSDWTIYEGLIVFGENTYAESCEEYPTDLMITADGGMIMDVPGDEGMVVRPVQSGEILRATGIYKNPEEQYYYRVAEGYIPAQRCVAQEWNLTAPKAEVTLPQIQPDKAFDLACKVMSSGGNLSSVKVNVLDSKDQLVQSASFAASGRMRDITKINVAPLKAGTYSVQVMAMVDNNLLEDGQFRVEKKLSLIYQQTFTVAPEEAEPASEETATTIALQPDGWSFIGDKRYYYKDGQPYVGWLCDGGNDYFFAPDGSVTTGWVKINGKWRCFTETGVMRTGWVDAPWGRCYLLSNGVPAVGEWEVDKMSFTFGEDGAMILK